MTLNQWLIWRSGQWVLIHRLDRDESLNRARAQRHRCQNDEPQPKDQERSMILNLRIKNHKSNPQPKDQPPNESEDSGDGEPDWICNAPSKGQGQSDGPSSAWINFQDPASTNMDISLITICYFI